MAQAQEWLTLGPEVDQGNRDGNDPARVHRQNALKHHFAIWLRLKSSKITNQLIFLKSQIFILSIDQELSSSHLYFNQSKTTPTFLKNK